MPPHRGHYAVIGVRPSDVAYIGSNSKTKRHKKTKLCTRVPQVTCDSHTDFKVKSQGHGAAAYCGEHQESCHLANGCRYNVIKILLNTAMLIIIQSNHFRVNSAI